MATEPKILKFTAKQWREHFAQADILQSLLTISTAHVKASDLRRLRSASDVLVCYQKEDYGWWICITPDDPPYLGEFSTAFQNLYELCGEIGIEWLCLDRDAPLSDHLPVFNG